MVDDDGERAVAYAYEYAPDRGACNGFHNRCPHLSLPEILSNCNARFPTVAAFRFALIL